MRFLVILLPFLMLAGCASVPMTGYISRVDHPYERKVYGSFEKVVSSTDYVLKKDGWKIINEVDSSVYEQDERYEGNGYQNLLIMTDIRKESFHLTGMHLNVFVHCLNDACDIEIRFESKTSVISSAANDQVVQGILDDIQDEVSR